jgi:hypothetical protein
VTDAGTLLRETLAEHADRAPATEDLATAARTLAGSRRWRRHTVAAVVACVVAGLLASGIVIVARDALGRQPVSGWTTTQAPAGWVPVSSLGVELSVPANWPVNGFSGCGVEPPFRVERHRGAVAGCGHVASPTSTVVAIERSDAPPGQDAEPVATKGSTATQQVSLAGAPAVLATSHLADGRTEMVLTVPAINVRVYAAGPDADLLGRVLHTTRVVDVDSAGCPRDLPESPSWDQPTVRPAVRPGTPESVTVCAYEGTTLGASARLAGPQSAALVAALAAAKAGPVPDRPKNCVAEPESDPLWLHLHYTDGPDQNMRIHYDGCRNRYVASASGQSQVTVAVLAAALNPLHTGYGFDTSLPKR